MAAPCVRTEGIAATSATHFQQPSLTMKSHVRNVHTPRRPRLVALVAITVGASSLAGCAAVQSAFGGGSGEAPVLELRNDLTQAVNVYVRRETMQGELFLRIVDAGAVDTIRLRGFPLGRMIRLRATTVSGDRTVEQDTIVVRRTSSWRVGDP